MRAIAGSGQRYGHGLDFRKELSQAFAALRWSARRFPTRKKINELRQIRSCRAWARGALGGVVANRHLEKVPSAAGTVIHPRRHEWGGFYLLIAARRPPVTLSVRAT